MAFFKQVIIDEETGERCDYKEENDVRRVVNYAMDKSYYTEYSRLALFSPGCVADQMIAFQRCRGRKMSKRAFHFVLSFYTDGYERFVDRNTIIMTMQWMNINLFPDCQKILCLHEDAIDHLHIHMVVNPVNLENYNIIRYNIIAMMYQLAEYLGEFHRISLQSISYQDMNGTIQKGRETGNGLYQKNWCIENGFHTVM